MHNYVRLLYVYICMAQQSTHVRDSVTKFYGFLPLSDSTNQITCIALVITLAHPKPLKGAF